MKKVQPQVTRPNKSFGWTNYQHNSQETIHEKIKVCNFKLDVSKMSDPADVGKSQQSLLSIIAVNSSTPNLKIKASLQYLRYDVICLLPSDG